VFQQYYERYPLIGGGVKYGQIRLLMQQGNAVVYERSLLNLGERQMNSELRWLPSGERLMLTLQSYARLREISAVFPALYVTLTEDRTLVMEPVWAARFVDGTVQSLMKAVRNKATADLPDADAQAREPDVPADPDGQDAESEGALEGEAAEEAVPSNSEAETGAEAAGPGKAGAEAGEPDTDAAAEESAAESPSAESEGEAEEPASGEAEEEARQPEAEAPPADGQTEGEVSVSE